MTLYKIVSERLDFVSFLSLIRDIRKHLRVICGGSDRCLAKDFAIRPAFFTAKFYLNINTKVNAVKLIIALYVYFSIL